MAEGKISLTREGYEKLQKELEELKVKRGKISQDIGEARDKGDISENAEYDAAKEAQALNEKKIAELEDTLSRASIIDDSDIPKDEALLGATVTVKDLDSGDTFDYMLVSEEESDYDMDKISTSSPVGQALLGHKVGDVVDVKVPAGVLKYEIVRITRQGRG